MTNAESPPSSSGAPLSFSRLREEVSSAVETEVRARVSAYEVSDEEYTRVSRQAWARFFLCAAQYHQSGLAPLGLVYDGPTGLTCIIKKAGISFLRPVDALEQMVVAGNVSLNEATAKSR